MSAAAVFKKGELKFGAVIVRFSHTYKKQKYWILECKCGKQFLAMAASINRGAAKTCGCVRKGMREAYYNSSEF